MGGRHGPVPPVSTGEVATLPAELRDRMRAAVVRGDGGAVLLVIAALEVGGPDLAPLASGLRRLAESYEYDRLIQLLGDDASEERP